MNKPLASVLVFLAVYVAGLSASLYYLQTLRQNYITGSDYVQPENVFEDVPNFADIDEVDARKATFFAYFEEKARLENARISLEREKLLALKQKVVAGKTLNRKEVKFVKKMAQAYEVELAEDKAETLTHLLRRVDIIPIALVQVQAAIESGWGRSRFAQEGNNYFGQWCFTEGCGLVPDARPQGEYHEVAKFSSPVDSLRAYMQNINTFHAYKKFRRLRAELRAADAPLSSLRLAGALDQYSERGQAYVQQVRGMIRFNQLESASSEELVAD